jgi:hypothetical protein
MADASKGKGKAPAGALNVERRTWDVEHFEKLAKEKLDRVRGRGCVWGCCGSVGVVDMGCMSGG